MNYTLTEALNKALNVMNSSCFYVVGRCLSGGRHYSEPLCYEQAVRYMRDYIGVVNYFGGGVVELLDDRGNVIKSEVTLDFD